VKCKKWNFGNDILNADIAVIVVENGAARHTHDTSLVQIASGSALVCG